MWIDGTLFAHYFVLRPAVAQLEAPMQPLRMNGVSGRFKMPHEPRIRDRGSRRFFVEGQGEDKTLIMIHGWPDTRRLWDGQVAHLKSGQYTAGAAMFDLSKPGAPTQALHVDTNPNDGPGLIGRRGVYKFPGQPCMICSDINEGSS